MADLQSFVTIAETGSTDRIFSALQDMVQADVGAIIFSCSTFDLAAGQSRRVFTNMPEVYPVSGLKEITPNDWTRRVLDGRKTFVANSLDEIRQVFPDHVLIGSLGCGSVINMPVFLSGSFMGTVNVLHEADYYSPARVQRMHDLRAAAMLAFCSLALAPQRSHG
jgi:hypothetical protein